MVAAASGAGVVPHLGLGLGMGMDLRLSSGGGSGGGRGQDYEESRSSDTTNPLNNNNISTHNNNHHPSAAMLSDFAESTMKELLSLYGITEGQRQGQCHSFSIQILGNHHHSSSCILRFFNFSCLTYKKISRCPKALEQFVFFKNNLKMQWQE
jgi:hypothetical protein